MSGPSGTWTTTSSGDGDSLAVLAKIAAVVVPCAAVYIAAQWVAHLPVYVSVGIPVAALAGLAGAIRAQMARNRVRNAEITARRAAIEEADRARWALERERKERHAMALAAAGAPVIHNNVTVDADAIAAALLRQHAQPAPVTVTAEAINR